jgi:exopolysaccharide production protein ExoQ
MLLIPASVLLISYFPAVSAYDFDPPSGTFLFNAGVASDKNQLGSLCMVLGLGILWQLLDELRPERRRTGRLLALGVLLGLILWLFYVARAATPLACFALGILLLVVLRLPPRARPSLARLAAAGIALTIVVIVFQYFVRFGDASVYFFLWRGLTLNGRTALWSDVLQMNSNPWIGTGFESFWIGPRIEYFWGKYPWHPNQAHNGYLEIYLTLGIAGLVVFALLALAGYRNAIRTYRANPGLGGLLLTYLAISPLYLIPEAAFKVMHPLWILFLLSVIAAPRLRWQAAGHEELAPGADPMLREDEQAAASPQGGAWHPAQVLTRLGKLWL